MKWNHFQRNIGTIVQIEPPAQCLDAQNHILPERNDDWCIEKIDKNKTASEAVELHNLFTNHLVKLGKDHIYDFRSDPNRNSDSGVVYGFLSLKIQIFLQGDQYFIRPNSRPGERVNLSNCAHHKVQWSPFIKIDASSSVPPVCISFVRIQYRIWSDYDGVPLLIRIASQQDGAMNQELSGPSGVIRQMVTEPQTFYVSLSHPTIKYEISVIGFQWSHL